MTTDRPGPSRGDRIIYAVLLGLVILIVYATVREVRNPASSPLDVFQDPSPSASPKTTPRPAIRTASPAPSGVVATAPGVIVVVPQRGERGPQGDPGRVVVVPMTQPASPAASPSRSPSPSPSPSPLICVVGICRLR